MGILNDNTGVVVIPPFRGPWEESKIRLNFHEHDATILFYLMYFENVAVAPYNVPRFGIWSSTEIERQLIQSNLIMGGFPTQSNFDQFRPSSYFEYASATHHALNQIHPGGWAMAPPASFADFVASDGLEALVLTMRRCLPCPRPDVPASELIEFRRGNAATLQRLQRSLNRLQFGLNHAVAQEDVMRLVQGELRDAVESVRNEVRAAGIAHGLCSLSFATRAIGAGVGGALGGLFAGPFGAALGAVAGAGVEFAIQRSLLSHEQNGYPRDFQYIASGIVEGLLEEFPDMQFEGLNLDFESRGNVWSHEYPNEIRQPPNRGGSMIGNVVASADQPGVMLLNLRNAANAANEEPHE